MSPSVVLISPDHALRESYLSLVSEFLEGGEKLVPFVLGFEYSDFDALLTRLADCSRGIGLPDGFVAHSTYWLVDDHGQVVGVSNIRHSLTPALRREGGHIGYGVRPSVRRRQLGTEILRLSLLRANDLGITRVLLTCGRANVASVSVIRRNGGALESEEYLADRGEVVQRYYIEVSANARA